MNRRTVMKGAAAIALAVGLTTGVMAQDKSFLTMDGFPAGTTPGQFGIAFTQMVQKHLPVEIQVSVGKPATKSALDAAQGKVDLFLSAPTINQFMQTQTAMFKKVNAAPELNKNLRGFINYPLGPYHIVVYEDSGIRSIADFKGKKVFLGPPAGAATTVATQLVAGASGLVPGDDFDVVKFDWKSAETAFIDRQMDVYIGPTTVPSPSIQQFALVSPIRILGISEEAFKSEPVRKALSYPGRTIVDIPNGIYDNQVNEAPVRTVGSWVGLGTNKDMDEELAYNMMKVFWEHLDEVHQTADWMKVINRETALLEMNIPLHIGAYRYYKELGWDIPAHLVPPEAK
ncbi:MAG: TAXI family TRAP transporter solute-binding subunit [Minwuia sp.]|nr:TAXI family TRAP transporter solute-binding subunit [Minwuia sp.]